MADPVSRKGIPPRQRRIGAIAAYLIAFAFLTGGDPRSDVRDRFSTLRRFWGMEAKARRLEGSAAAYDRRFAALLVAVADALPPQTPGLALDAPKIPEWGGLYLAVYQLAPTPVLLSPTRVPSGWPTLTYGKPEPPGARVLRRFPDGGLLLAPP